MSDSDYQESGEEEIYFFDHKMKTMNIIEDDISDIEGSIDNKKGQFSPLDQKGFSKVQKTGSN